LAPRLAAGESIGINFLPNDPKVVEYLNSPRQISWGMLIGGLLALPFALLASFLYSREARAALSRIADGVRT
jgi:ABC-type phosphate/phosphonate transport system permease subunit